MPFSRSRSDDAVDDFDDFDPTPYSGGYDQTLTYGRPIPSSDETCHPISISGDIDYNRPQFSSSSQISSYDPAESISGDRYARPHPDSNYAVDESGYGYQKEETSLYGDEGYAKPSYDEQGFGKHGYGGEEAGYGYQRKTNPYGDEGYGNQSYVGGDYVEGFGNQSYGGGEYRRSEEEGYGKPSYRGGEEGYGNQSYGGGDYRRSDVGGYGMQGYGGGEYGRGEEGGYGGRKGYERASFGGEEEGNERYKKSNYGDEEESSGYGKASRYGGEEYEGYGRSKYVRSFFGFFC